jgi:ABC-2 type transport system permease protein
MEATLRQTWAFLFRGYHITRRYIGWVIVFNFYALVTSATVALIGVAQGNYQLTLTLVVGALLWNYLSWLYNEIAMSIAYERWEGTLEYTFMAPVSRAVHLLGVSLFSLLNSIVTSIIVLVGLMAFTNLHLRGVNFLGVLVVLAVSTVAFVGLGLFAAIFPVMSAERGAEATHIFQGSLLQEFIMKSRCCRIGCNHSRQCHRQLTHCRRAANCLASVIRTQRRNTWPGLRYRQSHTNC